MPSFGFGTWLAPPTVIGNSVRKALEIGYRHIDCAHLYGNEAEIGEVFQDVFSAGRIKREDVFITSKLWVSDFGDVRGACELSLKNLQLDYLDLYLIHLPFEVDPDEFKFPDPKGKGVIGYKEERIEEVWRELETLVKEGKLKAIGVSNFSTHKLKNLLKCSLNVKIACNQVEIHPYLPQHRLVEFCETHGINLVAYSPLGSPGRPSVFKKESDPNMFEEPVVKKIAEKHKITVAQVLLAFGIHRKYGVLAKSVKEQRIKENFDCLNVKLDSDDMTDLLAIKTRFRSVTQLWALKVGQEEKDLWDGELYG